MTRRITVGLLTSLVLVAGASWIQGFQAPPTAQVPRAIRRDVPMTNAIRRAFDAGTRDQTGRPGPNYWQLQTDYTIDARLDPATQTITGTGDDHAAQQQPAGDCRRSCSAWTTTSSAASCRAARRCRPRTPTAWSITRLGVNGEAVDLAPAARSRARRGGGQPQRRNTASGLDQTLARITLATPIAAKSKATLEIAWRTKLPGGPNGQRPPHDAAVRRHACSSRRSGSRASRSTTTCAAGTRTSISGRRSSTTTSAAST